MGTIKNVLSENELKLSSLNSKLNVASQNSSSSSSSLSQSLIEDKIIKKNCLQRIDSDESIDNNNQNDIISNNKNTLQHSENNINIDDLFVEEGILSFLFFFLFSFY